MSTLSQRWDDYQERSANEQEMEDSFAIRGDGALVIFDGEGYFLLIADEGGTICLQGSDGHRENVYCEPAWITTGYYDIMLDYLSSSSPIRRGYTGGS